MKTVAALAGILLTSTVALVTNAAHAAQDEVDLVDGSVLQGRVVQQTPGSVVVIQTDDGRVQSIPWSQVKRVSALAPAFTPTPAPTPALVPTPDTASESSPPTPYAPPTTHFEMGARLGYSLGGGSYASGVSFTGADSTNGTAGISGGVPIAVDIGARIGKYVFVGAFAEYAFLSSACFTPGGGITLSCSSHDVRGGIEAQIHLRPRAGIDPWFGVAFGHDWLTQKLSASEGSASATGSTTFDGWNLVDVMFGVDFRTAGGLGFGPYLEMTSGNFSNMSTSSSGTGAASQSASASIAAQSSHQWFILGARGTFEAM